MQATLSRAKNMISGIAAATAVALGLVAVDFTPLRAQAPPPPIQVEPLTPRSLFTDDVRGQFTINKVEEPGTTPDPFASIGGGVQINGGWVPKGHPLAGLTDVLNMRDLSRSVVARITVQPGAQFPWHTHSGPVIVNIAQGELVYVEASDCIERPYPAGTAFVDPGRGHVHTAFNRTGGVTVIYATFFEVPAQGPLTITEGVEAPADCQIGS